MPSGGNDRCKFTSIAPRPHGSPVYTPRVRGNLSGQHGMLSSYQIRCDPSEGGMDRLDQFGGRGVAADRPCLMFDPSEIWLDVMQFRTVFWVQGAPALLAVFAGRVPAGVRARRVPLARSSDRRSSRRLKVLNSADYDWYSAHVILCAHNLISLSARRALWSFSGSSSTCTNPFGIWSLRRVDHMPYQ